MLDQAVEQVAGFNQCFGGRPVDDRGYVALLRLYLARTSYASGPLFRASINGKGGPLSYDAAHHRWCNYCATAGVGIDIH